MHNFSQSSLYADMSHIQLINFIYIYSDSSNFKTTSTDSVVDWWTLLKSQLASDSRVQFCCKKSILNHQNMRRFSREWGLWKVVQHIRMHWSCDLETLAGIAQWSNLPVLVCMLSKAQQCTLSTAVSICHSLRGLLLELTFKILWLIIIVSEVFNQDWSHLTFLS